MSKVTINNVMSRAELMAAIDKAFFEKRKIELVLGPPLLLAERWSYEFEPDIALLMDAANECKHHHNIMVSRERDIIKLCEECFKHVEENARKRWWAREDALKAAQRATTT
jgi:hypothetical protein